MKVFFIFILGCLIITCTILLYHLAINQSSYQGLQTVACLDPTKPIVESFTFSLQVEVHGKTYPLEKTIGHDYGNCLHEIYVNDGSGTVFVRANTQEQFTLGQFFDVWHKTFTSNQVLNYRVGNGHTLKVLLNNQPVSTYRDTLLQPNEHIEVIYE